MRAMPAVLVLMLIPARGLAAAPEVSTPDEFNARASALKPGDELVVRDGVYADWRVEAAASGAEGRPVVIRPQTPGGVTLRRATAVAIKGRFVEFRGFLFDHAGPDIAVNVLGSRCRVTECRFLHCGNPRSTFGHVVEVGEGACDNRVDHCLFEDSKSMSLGLRVRQEDRLALRNCFDHNTFRDIPHLSYNGQEPIQIGQGYAGSHEFETHALVEYNVFDHADGDAELISNKTSRNIIRYNVAAGCRAALVLRGGNDCLVEGNVLVRNRGGIRIHGRGHVVVNNLCAKNADYGIAMPLGGGNHSQAERCLVAHNTLVENGPAGITFSNYQQNAVRPAGNRILNNLIAGGAGVLLDLNGAADNEVAGNLFWPTGGAKVGFEGPGARLADPLLAGEEEALRPREGSPVRDAAARLAQVTRDRLGRTRPGGGGPDVGADEIDAAMPHAAAGDAVVLPPVPPPRPATSADAFKGDLVFSMDPGGPLRGWQREGDGKAEADGKMLRLEGATVWLAQDLPADFAAEWEYQPAALAARASIAFAAAGRKGGYTLAFGGKKDDKPDGVVTLAKGLPKHVVADGHDTVLPNRPKDPIPDPPNRWYRCRLVRRGGLVRLELSGTAVLVWNDIGVVGGPAPGAGAFGLRQEGAGSWRNLKIWKGKA